MSTKATVTLGICMLLGAFAIGIAAGHWTREKPSRRPTSKKTTEHEDGIRDKLATCRQNLLVNSSEVIIPQDGSTPEDAMRPDSEALGKVETLQEQLAECKKADFLHTIDFCNAPNRYVIPLLLPALHADKECVDKFGVADLYLRHLKMCPNFKENPPEYDGDDFRGQDQESVNQALDTFGRIADPVGNITRYTNRAIRKCRVKYGLSEE